MIVVSYGGGTNSTALLIGLLERGQPPDLALFADTGGEHPRTYAYVAMFKGWLLERGVELVRVSNGSYFPGGQWPRAESLEAWCHDHGQLPSKAYGLNGCSVKWKRQPMDRYVRRHPMAVEAWARGEKVTRYLGIDAGESHRSQATVDEDHKLYVYERPLIDWGWAREECLEAVERAGLPQPGKSACFYCPSAKKREVLELAEKDPALFKRAIALEKAGEDYSTSAKGLGRSWSWDALVKADKAQLKLFPEPPEMACICFDGDED